MFYNTQIHFFVRKEPFRRIAWLRPCSVLVPSHGVEWGGLKSQFLQDAPVNFFDMFMYTGQS